MEKREALQSVKEAKRRYLLWTGRVEAMIEGVSSEEAHTHPSAFSQWYATMGRVLRHFEEYRALKESHEQAHDLFLSIQAQIEGANGKGWADRLLTLSGLRQGNESSSQHLAAHFKQRAAEVLDQINRLERRLLVMRDAEWKSRQNGSWGRPARQDAGPSDWALITQH